MSWDDARFERFVEATIRMARGELPGYGYPHVVFPYAPAVEMNCIEAIRSMPGRLSQAGLAHKLIAVAQIVAQVTARDDGIIPLDPTHGEPALIIRLRDLMEHDLGREIARSLETQALRYLGTEALGEWLQTSRENVIENSGKSSKLPLGFFPWHVALYRNRPIFWLLSSENFERGKTRWRMRRNG